MSIALRGLHPSIRPAATLALQLASRYGIPVTVTSGARGWVEQDRLYRRFLDCKRRGERVHPGNPNPACRYPANPPGHSAHNYGLAFDSWTPPEYMPTWTWLRRHIGFVVPDHDQVHAEYPNWRDRVS